MTKRLLRCAASWIGCIGLLVPVCAPGSSSLGSDVGGTVRQYTSAGHVLAFDSGGYTVSNGWYAIRVRFEHAQPVPPSMLDAGDGATPDGKAAPLERVTYAGLWDGINVTYDAPQGGILRSTWTVAAGVDPAQIQLRYNRALTIGDDGSLSLVFETGAVSESRPLAWQEVDGRRQAVDVSFAKLGEEVVGFRVGAYRSDLPLTIDPTLTWNTFLGGSGGDEEGRAIVVDGSGNLYVAGYSSTTWGSPLHAHAGVNTAFVAKLTSAGVLTWNTFFGKGTGRAIAVDGSGNVYVAGTSSATWDSPVRSYTSGNDAFAAKLDSNGALIWNAFLGGVGSDEGNAIAVDGSDGVYVAGTSTANWGSPVRAFGGGNFDAFAARLDSNGALTWNTFLGSGGSDYGNAIVVDGSGNVYVAGQSGAIWGSPVRAFGGGSFDAFAAKLDSAGALTWNTFLGGTGIDNGEAMALDGSGNVYVAGRSSATWGSPVRPFGGVTYDAFAAKLVSNGALTWNTFLGGGGSDYCHGMAVDGSGNVFVVGTSDSATWGSPVRAFTGGSDGFAAKLNSAGALIWNTFLGGTSIDDAYGIAVDGSGNAFLAGTSTVTWGSPVRAFTGGGEGFAAKVNSAGSLMWNTFLGGGSGGEDYAKGIAVDEAGNVYVAGYSLGPWGAPVRAYTADNDAFAAKLDSAGELIWNTFLGGSDFDSGDAIALDGSGNVYVTGRSRATWGSPVRSFTVGDAFVAKLTSAGVLTWNTFLGGTLDDTARGIAVDGNGNVYVAGTSMATWGSPVRSYTSGEDAFAAKLDSAGVLTWNTFLGCSNGDQGRAIAVDGDGNVYVAGHTSQCSWGNPVRTFSGSIDAFAAKLDSAGALVWNSFLGGGGGDYGNAIVVDGNGNVYVAGHGSATWGSPLRAFSGNYDAFAAKLDAAGGLIWNTFLGNSSFDEADGVAVDGGGNVYLTGYAGNFGTPAYGSCNGALVARLDSGGVLTWHGYLCAAGSGAAIALDGAGNIYVAGWGDVAWGSPVRAYTTGRDAFVAKMRLCGDGTVTSPEQCDDDNAVDGDGCSATCQIESGYTCSGQPSVCLLDCNGSPSNPANGSYAPCAGTNSGGTCALTCDSGYASSGSARCTNGIWSTETCSLASCPDNASGAPNCACDNGYSGTLGWTGGSWYGACSANMPEETATQAGADTPTSTPTAADTPTDIAAATITVTPVPPETPTPTVIETVTDPDGKFRLPALGWFVSGHIRYLGSLADVQWVRVFGKPYRDGRWVVTPELVDEWKNILRGLSALDATQIQMVVIGSIAPFDPATDWACDTTGDGTLSTLDAIRIQELRVGLRNRLPVAEKCGSDWAFFPVPGPDGEPKSADDPDWDPNDPSVCRPGAVSYETLSASAADQDFVALLYGDCTHSWTPSTGGGMSSAVELLDGSVASVVDLPDCSGPCAALATGDEVLVEVTHLDGAQAFDLVFDVPDGTTVDAVKQGELPAGAGDCSLLSGVRDGKLRVSLGCLTPIRGRGALLSLAVANTAGNGVSLSRCVVDEREVPCGSWAALSK